METEEPRHQEFLGTVSLVGCLLLPGRPPPHKFPSTIRSTVGWRESSDAGAPVQVELGASSQTLVVYRQRWAASEDPLSPMVEGSLNTEQRLRFGEGREEQERGDKGSGGGQEVSLEGIRRDMET